MDSVTAVGQQRGAQPQAQPWHRALATGDAVLALAVVALLCVGAVMVASASIEYAGERYGDAWYFLRRHLVYAGIGVALALALALVPINFWARWGAPLLMLGALALLVLVLVPGIGQEANGSRRWLSFGPLRLQPSELAKFCFIAYLAAYIVNHRQNLRHGHRALVGLVLLLGLVMALLLSEPDLGAAAVIAITALGVLFLTGARLSNFLLLGATAVGACVALAFTSPYRLRRLQSFLDPWSDPLDGGYQLIQSLIAYGRGEWFGLGLGHSIQKQFFLPESHTDFIFSVLAEELGLVGVVALISLLSLLVARLIAIGRRAERSGQDFAACFCYGVGILFAVQSFINIGMTAGLLPTKGLTLPFISYGGSSLVVSCMMVGLALRVDHESWLHHCRHSARRRPLP